jgi:NTE family protein
MSRIINRRVAVALGSGGARGYAHIGALQVLEEEGFEVVSVAGSSMGAVVGSIYAAGHLAPFTEWVTGLSQRDVVRLLDPAIGTPGVIKAERVIAKMRDLLAGARIEDLPIPFTAVATDLLGRRAVWFRDGPTDVAVRASIAMPGIITPIVVNGRLLSDGGMLDPVPVAAAQSARAELLIAISLLGERSWSRGPGALEETPPTGQHEVETGQRYSRLRERAAQILDHELIRAVREMPAPPSASREHQAESRDPNETVTEDLPSLSAAEVLLLSLEAMQSLILEQRLGSYPPDLLVSVPKDACRTLDFQRAPEMIELGRRLMRETLDEAELGG